MAATAGDEMAATCGVKYTDKGELEFDEDEMAALEGQRLVAELFPDSGSKPDFEGFHASEPAGNLNGGYDSESEAVTESDDDEDMTGRLSDAAAAAAYRTNPNLPDFIHQHGPLIHVSGSSAYEIFCSLFPDELLALLVEESNRYYDQTCCTRWPGQPSIIDPVTNTPNVRRLCASILVSNGFTR